MLLMMSDTIYKRPGNFLDLLTAKQGLATEARKVLRLASPPKARPPRASPYIVWRMLPPNAVRVRGFRSAAGVLMGIGRSAGDRQTSGTHGPTDSGPASWRRHLIVVQEPQVRHYLPCLAAFYASVSTGMDN